VQVFIGSSHWAETVAISYILTTERINKETLKY